MYITFQPREGLQSIMRLISLCGPYANIEQIKLILNFLKTYSSEIYFCSSRRVEHNVENEI
jgi:hypothetical protein